MTDHELIVIAEFDCNIASVNTFRLNLPQTCYRVKTQHFKYVWHIFWLPHQKMLAYFFGFFRPSTIFEFFLPKYCMQLLSKEFHNVGLSYKKEDLGKKRQRERERVRKLVVA